VEGWGLLLDAGDGVSAGLLQKSHGVKVVAITHSDRDHMAGLLQFRQLNARDGAPLVVYPKDCHSFPILAEFMRQFDAHAQGDFTWRPLSAGDRVPLDADLWLAAHGNDHLPDAGPQTKSFGYRVIHPSHRLRPELLGKSTEELGDLADERGQEFLTVPVDDVWLGYSGDSSAGPAERWKGTRILLHECTFLCEEDAGDRTGRDRHSLLPQVAALAAEVQPEALVLLHFSSRYQEKEIAAAVKRECRSCGLTFPVWMLAPGQITHDLFRETPVWPEKASARRRR
jgi:ribonuclease Z